MSIFHILRLNFPLFQSMITDLPTPDLLTCIDYIALHPVYLHSHSQLILTIHVRYTYLSVQVVTQCLQSFIDCTRLYYSLGNPLEHEKCRNTETPVNIYRKREELLLRNYRDIS